MMDDVQSDLARVAMEHSLRVREGETKIHEHEETELINAILLSWVEGRSRPGEEKASKTELMEMLNEEFDLGISTPGYLTWYVENYIIPVAGVTEEWAKRQILMGDGPDPHTVLKKGELAEDAHEIHDRLKRKLDDPDADVSAQEVTAANREARKAWDEFEEALKDWDILDDKIRQDEDQGGAPEMNVYGDVDIQGQTEAMQPARIVKADAEVKEE